MECIVIAHRGSNKLAPQNTLPAFRQAIAEGTDGFETDVHLTKDGKLVICHNYTVDSTSDASGQITSYTLAELKMFDFGSYFSADFAGTPLPTLDEFLELTSAYGESVINIELKSPKKSRLQMVRKTVEAVKKYGVLDRVIISSFDTRILKAVKAVEPDCRTAFLYPTNKPAVHRFECIPFITAKTIGADIIHPAYPFVTPLLVKTAHRLGLKVNVWTVDDEQTVRRMLRCGVDGIITNRPGKVKEYIAKFENGNLQHK